MKRYALLILVLVFPFLIVSCAPKQMYRIQIHETIEDTEFEGMYGPKSADALPETGIVVNNTTNKDLTVKLKGETVKEYFMLSGSTLSAPLPLGVYEYNISVEEHKQTQSQSLSFSKALKKEIPIKSLTGRKTVREKCRTTFNVFIEEKLEE